ncbi:uncharacterized protein MYCGRDRAFT_96650 [Zymoseptoria tritici IPO323]|uniref:BTB domain-containing protein n=1 Tax=Zymoseptoria tritici (strain CBS 115943 / IPO323) TaxID=336722 RepID=F9XN25_ZYMTI|nr:uncharacterized protein MYCGRDRAFT_96650 [Zymoseptoria tritici IPO323]EGP83339.1 hypothetical protein MYCGRDRAFT_96650 [Zymoseptoria tritici IPO323]
MKMSDGMRKADFNDESFSDVKIEIYTGVDDQSDRRSFHCHKLVLKKDSEVFATAFNKNSRFADANSAVYKVFEEDLDGIEAYLKGRYGIAPSDAETADWEFMLKLAYIASKYGNSKAAREYWDDFRAAFKKVWDNTRPTAPKQAEEMLKKLLLCEDVAFEEWNSTTSKGLLELVGLRYVRNNHNGLIKDDDFYEWISGYPRLWRKCLAAFTAVAALPDAIRMSYGGAVDEIKYGRRRQNS